MFQIFNLMTIFCSQLRRGGASNATKTKRLSKAEVKEQLIDSLIESERVATEGLNEKANKLENSQHNQGNQLYIISNIESYNSYQKEEYYMHCISQGKVYH